jgi:hypothetical protein
MKVLIGHGRQTALLVSIHGSFCGLHGVRGSGFDFDKAQHAMVPGDQVNFSAAARRAKIPRYHYESQAAEIEVRILFAATTRPLMHGSIVGRKRPLRYPIQCPNYGLRSYG